MIHTGIRELAPVAQPSKLSRSTGGSLAQLYRIRSVRQPDAIHSRQTENGSLRVDVVLLPVLSTIFARRLKLS